MPFARKSLLGRAAALATFSVLLALLAPVAGLPAAAAPQCVPAPQGLANWWPGEDSGQDIKAGNAVTLMNGAGFAAGKVGRAFSFDGVDDKAVSGTTSVMNTLPLTI